MGKTPGLDLFSQIQKGSLNNLLPKYENDRNCITIYLFPNQPAENTIGTLKDSLS